MTHSPDTFFTQNLTAVQSLKRLSLHFFSTIEKLTALNMAASKTLLAGSFHHAQNLLEVRQPQQLLDLQLAVMVPLADKVSSYTRHVFALATDTSSEFGKVTEARTSLMQKALADGLASLTPHAPETAKGHSNAIN